MVWIESWRLHSKHHETPAKRPLRPPIALGVLKIKAKLGELLPAKPAKETGAMKGLKKGSKPDLLPFSKPIISAFRKIAANVDKLDAYYDATEDVPTQTDFIKTVTIEARAKKESERERK